MRDGGGGVVENDNWSALWASVSAAFWGPSRLPSCKIGRQGSASFFKVGFFVLFCALVNFSHVWTSFHSFCINSDSSPKNKYGKSLSIILEESCIYILRI